MKIKIVTSVLVGLLLTATGCNKTAQTREPKAQGEIRITSPSNGAKLSGGSLQVVVANDTGIKILAADGDTSGKTGHWHVFIDREPLAQGQTIPKEAGIVHSAVSPIAITGLKPGEHKLTVVVGDGTHKRIGTEAASVTVTMS